MLGEFTKNIQNGIAFSPNDDGCWNFYEWSEESYLGEPFEKMENIKFENGFYDGLYNAFLCFALQKGSYIAKKLGKKENAEKYEKVSENLKKTINNYFYDEEKKSTLLMKETEIRHIT